MKKLVIFDWDGTLIDSADKIISCMQLAAPDAGLPALEAEPIRNIIGLGLQEAVIKLYGSLEAAQVKQLRDAYSRYFVEADQQPCQFFPGVMDTLESLKMQGFTLAVATGKSRRGLDRVLQRLNLSAFFAASRCADETQSKPHPRMLYELCEELGIAGERAIMVGDTEYDMEMASRADIARIGVSYGAHAVERLQRWRPAAVIDMLPELREHLG